jgi:hypothetical protein
MLEERTIFFVFLLLFCIVSHLSPGVENIPDMGSLNPLRMCHKRAWNTPDLYRRAS